MRALLDACVLAAPTRRALLLEAARAGAFEPLWSDRIEEEWRRAAGKGRGGVAATPAALAGEIALANAAFPGARQTGWEALEGPLSLPDWHDRHVLAAALHGRADVIITDNLRDFPRRALAGHGLRAEASDAFLWELAGREEPALRAALQALDGAVSVDVWPGRLKRARLPRLARAVAAWSS